MIARPVGVVERYVFPAAVTAVVLLYLPTFYRSFTSTRLSWMVTEMLINYDAGFVRRGLSGEIIQAMWRWTGLSPFHLIAAIYAVLTVFIIAAFAWLVRSYRRRHVLLALMLLFSPGLLLFPVHEWMAYLRKDSFIIAALLGHAVMARRFAEGRLTQRGLTVFYALVLIPWLSMVMFLHEMQLFFLLPHVCMTYVVLHLRGERVRRTVLLFVIPAALAVIPIRSPGHAGMVASIEQSLTPMGIKVQTNSDQNAIGAIGWSVDRSRNSALSILKDPWSMLLYCASWLLSVAVPGLALAGVVATQGPKSPVVSRHRIAVYLVLICLAPTPLFILGSDFGRWISLTAFGVIAFLLSMPLQPDPPVEEAPARSRPWLNRVGLAMCAVYVLGWTLPYFGTEPQMLKSGMLRSVKRTGLLLAGRPPKEGRSHRTTATLPAATQSTGDAAADSRMPSDGE